MGIEVVLDRWDGDDAVLRTEDGQEIIWPGEKLPSGIDEGSVLYLQVSSEAAQEEDDPRVDAKAILNEIFDAQEEEE